MGVIDHREIIYRKIFSLDSLDRQYYQNFFNLMMLLMDESQREELSVMIYELRELFANGDSIPSFYIVQDSLYNAKAQGRQYVKVGRGSSGLRVSCFEAEEKLNEIKLWCLNILYKLQKDIRFTSGNNMVV